MSNVRNSFCILLKGRRKCIQHLIQHFKFIVRRNVGWKVTWKKSKSYMKSHLRKNVQHFHPTWLRKCIKHWNEHKSDVILIKSVGWKVWRRSNFIQHDFQKFSLKRAILWLAQMNPTFDPTIMLDQMSDSFAPAFIQSRTVGSSSTVNFLQQSSKLDIARWQPTKNSSTCISHLSIKWWYWRKFGINIPTENFFFRF